MIYPTRHPASTPRNWRDEAICARPEVAEEFWYSSDFGEQTVARSICADCPVRVPCLRDGLDEEYGVWAGYTATERSRLRRRLPRNSEEASVVIEHAALLGPRVTGVADPNNPTHRKAM
jgi:WhiB family redox-sensing transcriptional regulator